MLQPDSGPARSADSLFQPHERPQGRGTPASEDPRAPLESGSGAGKGDTAAADGAAMPETEIIVGDERKLRLRPIRTNDAQSLVEMGLRSTPEDLRLRFFSPVHPAMGHLTSLLTDFDREVHIAVAAYDPAAVGEEAGILGVVRLVLSVDAPEGAFAIMVRSDQAGHGLGHRLMAEMLGWARHRGLTRVTGEILSENRRMLRLAKAFGAVIQPQSDDFHTVKVSIDLTPQS